LLPGNENRKFVCGTSLTPNLPTSLAVLHASRLFSSRPTAAATTVPFFHRKRSHPPIIACKYRTKRSVLCRLENRVVVLCTATQPMAGIYEVPTSIRYATNLKRDPTRVCVGNSNPPPFSFHHQVNGDSPS